MSKKNEELKFLSVGIDTWIGLLLDSNSEHLKILNQKISKADSSEEVLALIVQNKYALGFVQRHLGLNTFEHQKFVGDKMFMWSWRVKLDEPITEARLEYKVDLVYSIEDDLDSLGKIDKELEAIESNPQLFQNDEINEIENKKKSKARIEKRIIDSEENFPTIVFPAVVQKIENKVCQEVTFGIPAAVVSMINDKKDILDKYGMRLVV